MRHVIIGGAGFIGSNLAERLLASGEDVAIVDNFSRAGALENVTWLQAEYPRINVVPADIRSDQEKLAKLVATAAAVYHLAAQVAVTTSVASPRLDFEINAVGTLNVLEALRETGSQAVLLYSSTNKVYGSLDDVPLAEEPTRYRYANRLGIDERFPLDPHSPYGCSKGAGDQYVRDYGRIYGLNTVVLRQSCIYGPRQFGVEDQGWLAWFCIAAVIGRRISLYGTGKQVRDLLHVSDLVDLMLDIVARGGSMQGEIFNVGGGDRNALSLLEAIGLIEQQLETSLDPIFSEARPGDQRVYVSDIRKLERILGWTPRISVSEGTTNLLGWVQDNRGLLGRAGVAFEAALQDSETR